MGLPSRHPLLASHLAQHRLLELAPVNWKTSRDSADVRARLDADPLRRLTFTPET
jgi:hypothetical protein